MKNTVISLVLALGLVACTDADQPSGAGVAPQPANGPVTALPAQPGRGLLGNILSDCGLGVAASQDTLDIMNASPRGDSAAKAAWFCQRAGNSVVSGRWTEVDLGNGTTATATLAGNAP